MLAEPVGHLVGVEVKMVVQVDHRLHDHLGPGVGAPGPDLVGAHPLAPVLHPRQVQTPADAADGGLGQVDVEDDLAGLRSPRLRRHRVAGLEFEGQPVAGELAGRDRAAHLQRLRSTRRP